MSWRVGRRVLVMGGRRLQAVKQVVLISNHHHGTPHANPSAQNSLSSQSHWEIRMSTSRGVPYFYNTETRTSVWDTPEGLTPEDVEKLPGAEYLTRPAKVRASHLLVKHSGSRNPSSWREVWRDSRSPILPLTAIFAPGQNNSFKGRSY